MRSLLALGTLAFCLSSLVVGLRLGALALRTRRMPEAIFALALLSAGALGYGNAALASSGISLIPGTGVRTIHVAMLGVGLGAAGVGLFTWRVFRASSAWAATAWASGVALIAGSLAMQLGTGHGDVRDLTSIWFWLGFAPRALAYGWSGVESLAYYGRMRRRERLGLGDPEVSRRFRLWGIAALSAFGMHGPVVWDALHHSPRPGMEPVSSAIAALLGLTCAGALWAAFALRGRRSDAVSASVAG
jgi:hypothetical protein